MPLNITQGDATARPVIPGHGRTGELPQLITEVLPLVKEAMSLPTDKALPLTVPADEASDLVRALRGAGEQVNVTVRFKRFPRLDDNGEQVFSTPEDGKEPKPLSDPFEYADKRRTKARVTFWTTKKVIRKSKQNGGENTEPQNTSD